MKSFLAALAAMFLLFACGDSGKPHQQMSVAATDTAPAPGTFALGTDLSPDGFVPQDAAADSFVRGREVFLSVDVTGASTDQQIQVEWRDPSGRLLRRESRHIGEGARYVAFSSGRTALWRRGPHRAIVTINGREVTEKTFAVL